MVCREVLEVVVVELAVGAGEELFRFALGGEKSFIEVFAGDEGLLVDDSLVEDLGGGGVAQGSVFFRGRVIDEAAVVHAAEGAAPAHVAFGDGADFRPAKGGSPARPLGVVVVAMAAAGGEGGVGGHHGEVFGAVVIADEFHGKGGAGIFAVAVVGAGGDVVAVGDRALIHVGTEEAVGAFHGGIDFRVFYAEFAGEGDEEKAAVAGGVEGAVAGVHFVEPAAVERRIGEGVPQVPALLWPMAASIAYLRRAGRTYSSPVAS
jgi:hypothetical protein